MCRQPADGLLGKGLQSSGDEERPASRERTQGTEGPCPSRVQSRAQPLAGDPAPQQPRPDAPTPTRPDF